MMRALTVRMGAVAAVAAGLLAGGGAGAGAVPVTVPGWRIVAQVLVAGQESIMTSIDAPAGNDAWAAGFSHEVPIQDLNRRPLIVEHWAGHQWQRVAMPAKVRSAFHTLDPFEETIRARASDAWVFGSNWLNWTGSRWRSGSLPSAGRKWTPNIADGTVFGRANVWAFGGVYHGDSVRAYAAHYNGHRWTEIGVPGQRQITGVSALAPNDIWAVTGPTTVELIDPFSTPGASMMRWNGKAWTGLPLPATLAKHGYLTSVIARSDRDIWVAGAIQRVAGPKHLTPIAAHWNGRAWSVVRFGGTGRVRQYLVNSLAPDGSGGLWASVDCLGCQQLAPQLMWHLRNGRWTELPSGVLGTGVKAGLVALAEAGHGSSVWGVGAETAKPTHGVIALSGRAP